MVVLYPVLLGVSHASEDAEHMIARNYNFITHATLAGVGLVRAAVCTF